MVLREQDKHFIWSILAATGIIFVWKGLWEGIYEIPYIGNEWVALFIGFALLTLSGLIFNEFDPMGSLEKSISKIVHHVKTHPKKHEFRIKYRDKIRKKDVVIRAGDIRKVEKGSLIIKGQQEIFIPTHRIKEVSYKGKTYWRL